RSAFFATNACKASTPAAFIRPAKVRGLRAASCRPVSMAFGSRKRWHAASSARPDAGQQTVVVIAQGTRGGPESPPLTHYATKRLKNPPVAARSGTRRSTEPGTAALFLAARPALWRCFEAGSGLAPAHAYPRGLRSRPADRR